MGVREGIAVVRKKDIGAARPGGFGVSMEKRGMGRNAVQTGKSWQDAKGCTASVANLVHTWRGWLGRRQREEWQDEMRQAPNL